MTEIVVYGPAAVSSAARLPVGLDSGHIGMIVVVVLGVALLTRFVWRVLFTPVEEAPLPAYHAASRAPTPLERSRPRSSSLLHFSRHR
jgi:hypothetical protein